MTALVRKMIMALLIMGAYDLVMGYIRRRKLEKRIEKILENFIEKLRKTKAGGASKQDVEEIFAKIDNEEDDED